MRPHDLAAIALVLAACLVMVEANWQPPRIEPSQASNHIGERVQIHGMVVELRHFSNGGASMVLAAGGSAIHARLPSAEGIVQQAWVVAEGALRRDSGRPLLEVESISAIRPPEGTPVPLAQVAAHPAEHIDDLLQIQATVRGSFLVEQGHRLRLVGDAEEGPQPIQGILRYDPSCACYAFYVSPWTH